MEVSALKSAARTAKAGSLPAPPARAPGDTSPAAICLPIFEELTVNANGDIVCSSCDVNGRWVYGNVFTDRIAEVYNGPLYQGMRAWQLKARPDTWCPAINYQCPRRDTPAEDGMRTDDRKVRILKLEPTTHCNIDCPACPVVTNFVDDEHLVRTRAKRLLPLQTMLDVVAQLPDLEQILYYNFGEPFLHKGTVDFLRAVKRDRPEIQILTNTNGLVLTPAQIKALGEEALMDRVIFSIDGAFPETYARYRVGGELEAALAKMRALAEARAAAGAQDRFDITWQYILFEWNDSDEEIAHAKALAREMGVPITWVITTGYGASKRFLSGTAASAALNDPPWATIHMAAHAELADQTDPRGIDHFRLYETYRAGCEILALPEDAAFQRHPNPVVRALRRLGRGGYKARFDGPAGPLQLPKGATIEFKVDVTCKPLRGWSGERRDSLRLGARLKDLATGEMREVTFNPTIFKTLGWNGRQEAAVTVMLPDRPGRYELILDLVREHVAWFSEMGSEPLRLELLLA